MSHLAHEELCTAVARAVAIEREVTGVAHNARLRWLTEAELAARIRSALVAIGAVEEPYIKVQGSGRREGGATSLPDIIVGGAREPIEVVYMFAKAAPSPGKPLSNDLRWLRRHAPAHVVAFLPRMREGFRIQRHKTPYDLAHAPLVLNSDEMLLTDSVQMGGLSSDALKLCNGAFVEVTGGRVVARRRWSLGSCAYVPAFGIVRSTVGKSSDPLWALVWSNVK